MGLVKLALNKSANDKTKLETAKKVLLNGLVLTGVGTGLYGDALMLKKMIKK